MKISDFIDELYRAAMQENKIEEFEIYYSNSDSFSVKVFEGEIDSFKNAKGLGVSLRGLVNGKMGYSYTTKISLESVKELIAEVIKNANVLETFEKMEIFQGSEKYEAVDNFNEKFEEFKVADKIQFAKDMESYAKSLDKRVTAVNYCLMQTGKGERAIRNSKNLYLRSMKNSGAAYISVVVKENESNRTAYSFTLSNKEEEYDFKKIAEDAVKKAVEKLGAKPVKTGKYPVIFSQEAFASLLESFTGIFSAEAVDKGLSQLKGKIGEKIAHESLVIVENPFIIGGAASESFDDEGVATKYKKVIDKGVLTTYFHNLKTARKFNVEPTGNGFKASYAGSISIGPTNFYIEKGNETLEEMLRRKEEVIYITDLAGLHSGLNPISGDFSLSAEGIFYKNGERVHPVSQITVAGNFFNIIKDIDGIGDDLKFGLDNIGSPSILISELSVSGE